MHLFFFNTRDNFISIDRDSFVHIYLYHLSLELVFIAGAFMKTWKVKTIVEQDHRVSFIVPDDIPVGLKFIIHYKREREIFEEALSK